MAREILVYADESTKRGAFFSDFYGGLAVTSDRLDSVTTSLRQVCEDQQLLGELKWQKVSKSYLGKYTVFVNRVFDLMVRGDIRMRVMFTEDSMVPTGLSDYHREHAYHILYRYFLKHAFGLEHASTGESETRVRFYLDRLPGTKERNSEFRSRISALEQYPPFRRARLRLPPDQVTEVDSKDHLLLQAVDVVLGSIQFRLNDKHLVKPKGATRRGSKTIAKEKLYRVIQGRIQDCYPRRFNIGITTSDRGDRANRWRDPYRHWRFLPRDAVRDRDLTK